MPLVQINRNPTNKDLRWFGILFAAFFGLVGWLTWRRHGPGVAPTVLWTLAVAVPTVYSAVPRWRRPIYVGWMYLVYPIGMVVSLVVLGLVYFAVITPIGLALRASGRDPMQRAFERARPSYWVEHRTGEDARRYFSQY